MPCDEPRRAYEPLPLQEEYDSGAYGLSVAFALAVVIVGIGVIVYSLIRWL